MQWLARKSRNMGSRERKGEAEKQERATAAIHPLLKRLTFNERDAEWRPLPWPKARAGAVERQQPSMLW